MTTAAFTRAARTADQIRAESRQLDPVKVLLTLAMVLPFVLGWLAGMVVRALWTAVAWTWTAAVVGFRAARPAGDRPT